jgi:hypothetical protein
MTGLAPTRLLPGQVYTYPALCGRIRVEHVLGDQVEVRVEGLTGPNQGRRLRIPLERFGRDLRRLA